jgi:sugar phosphate isomerase/epimerase
MKKISRREFFGKSVLGIGSALVASRIPIHAAETSSSALHLPLGFQVWTVKDMLVKDFPGTLKKIADLGYESVEMCSPQGYVSSGFGPLTNIPAKEMKRIINDAGLKFESTHYGLEEFRNNLDERIQFALDSGQKQMILSSFGLPENATSDDWKKAADELNTYGEKAKKAGIQMGFHNHHNEFQKVGDILIYDLLMDRFDPELVKMQFQVAVINIGYKASDFFKKYPGRFISAHLADWSDAEKKNIALGKGIVDWNEFFNTAQTGGVKNIFVEMEPETFGESAEFIHKL